MASAERDNEKTAESRDFQQNDTKKEIREILQEILQGDLPDKFIYVFLTYMNVKKIARVHDLTVETDFHEMAKNLETDDEKEKLRQILEDIKKRKLVQLYEELGEGTCEKLREVLTLQDQMKTMENEVKSNLIQIHKLCSDPGRNFRKIICKGKTLNDLLQTVIKNQSNTFGSTILEEIENRVADQSREKVSSKDTTGSKAGSEGGEDFTEEHHEDMSENQSDSCVAQMENHGNSSSCSEDESNCEMTAEEGEAADPERTVPTNYCNLGLGNAHHEAPQQSEQSAEMQATVTPKTHEAMRVTLEVSNTGEKIERRVDVEEAKQQTVETANQMQSLLRILCLNEWYPQLITYQTIIRIDREESTKLGTDLEPSEVPLSLLKRLLNYDHSGRHTVPSKSRSSVATTRSWENDSDDDLNPMDILLTCYLCCDKEMQQILCKTLFTCKFAFPFIYTDCDNSLTMSNWSLRDIVVEFRDQCDTYIETSLISDHPFPVVSFVRIGELPDHVSKSRLLNSLLNGNDHATFFHRDCINGHAERVCSNGLVEATVLLPSRTDGSEFNTAFLATNLRGDLMVFRKQAQILEEISQIFVIFIDLKTLDTEECLSRLRQVGNGSNIMLVVFNSDFRQLRGRTGSQVSEEMEFLESLSFVTAYQGRKNKSEKEFLKEIQKVLVTKLSSSVGAHLAFFNSAITDEDKVLVGTRQKATELLERITNVKQEHLTQECLSLSTLWRHYSQLHRQEHCPTTETSLLNESKMQKLKIRGDQIEILKCNGATSTAQHFVRILSPAFECQDNGLVAKLFLQWMKLLLDQSSRRVIPQLRKKQRELTDRFFAESKTARKKMAKQLKEVKLRIENYSVGLEHFLREAGQVYEAVYETELQVSQEMEEVAVSLPNYFSKLLLWGVPLEILDGDASNVPASWISAILKCCKELVGDKKIYVISVLGLQSSGKSTLLNTMFGLKFAVSAGRCTRGAFMQLVPVEAGMPFDYIAVIDTEGLRAPELASDKHHHDNELATLVIGLSDVTIINIKGENAAEMKDILQIAIHAFIRMKMANKMRDLHRHCIFIHQNVPAVGAKEKMQEATFKMQRTLDEITKEAAEGEGLASVKRFGDVLEFNRDTDIFYMPDLWQGDPPMAPVNPGYSESVRKIKQHLLHVLDNEQKSFLGFTDFSHRMNDLWKAIMSEDFVFSFKNSIELKAYNLMENTYIEETNRMEQVADDWFHKTASIRIRKCSTSDELKKEEENMMRELRKLLDSEQEKQMAALEEFFKENRYSEQTVQWKERKLASVRESVKALETSVKRKLEVLYEGQKVDVEQAARRGQWESNLLEKARELEMRVKNMPLKQIEEEFETLWQQFISQLPTERDLMGESIERQITDFLRTKYYSEQNYVSKYLDEMTPMSNKTVSLKPLIDVLLPEDDSVQQFIVEATTYKQQVVKFFRGDTKEASSKMRQHVYDAAIEVLNSIKPLCDDIPRETICFSKRHAANIQECISTNLTNKACVLARQGIKTTTTFEIKLVVCALRFACPIFEELNQRYYERNSLKGKLTQAKSQMWNLFKNLVREQDSAKVAAEFCRDHMKTVMKQAIHERMPSKFKGRLLNDIGRTKFQMIVHMLTDMARRDDFESISEYIRYSHTSALAWLTSFVHQKLFSRSTDEETLFISTIQSELLWPMFAATEQAAKTAAANSPSLQQWITRFCKEMEVELAVKPDSLQHICQFQVKVEDVLKFFLSSLKDLKSDLIQFYAAMNDTNIKWHGERTLYSEILESIWGCKEQCPFCNEPCSRSLPQHYLDDGSPHHCIQHRPEGVNGVFYKGSNELVFETCEHSVNSAARFSCDFCKRSGKQTGTCQKEGSKEEVYHPYKEYKKYFSEWEIDPDASNTSAKFWSWFSWTFRAKLKEKHQKGIKTLPPAWASVSKQEAIDSLRGLLE